MNRIRADEAVFASKKLLRKYHLPEKQSSKILVNKYHSETSLFDHHFHEQKNRLVQNSTNLLQSKPNRLIMKQLIISSQYFKW